MSNTIRHSIDLISDTTGFGVSVSISNTGGLSLHADSSAFTMTRSEARALADFIINALGQTR